MAQKEVKKMRCGCGAEYRVDEHKNGYSIRCEDWAIHRHKEVENENSV